MSVAAEALRIYRNRNPNPTRGCIDGTASVTCSQVFEGCLERAQQDGVISAVAAINAFMETARYCAALHKEDHSVSGAVRLVAGTAIALVRGPRTHGNEGNPVCGHDNSCIPIGPDC